MKKEFKIGKKRGCYAITDEILHQIPEINNIKIGIANFILKYIGDGLH